MAANPHDWLNEHGDYLYRFALTRLRDPHQAEDVVQETLLAAIKSTTFAEQSSPRTWLTGILKHKIIDCMRKQLREIPASELLAEEDANMDEFFDDTGHWAEKPQAWDIPHDALQQKQFLQILQQCMARLPQKLAAIFTMRDVDELDNEEICKALNITATNAWVMLYRARMGLRKCLEMHW
ncbi:sigma-70 family RNA polymerase sigma factor [Methylophilus sp. QUAN]|uniref:sigma-70 family RNA polymerase sigma factor n=1 Tax=Methylophilus sp. QUAN TaxID=2781020 RepID=UPI00188E1416|nr:sigma-70 family RNA polymerase sigma factor [Methylophilus sp. QUAN]MBF4990072.1 sigma-70 family RNA polymerase sigma factor [Methylophilus sp. QUAN]